MTYPGSSKSAQKIKRIADKSNIHNLFIFNKSGICIYGFNLTNLYPLEQEQLISSYFTALMSFTKELIGEKIKTVEMGVGIKLVVFEKKNLYYSIICNSIENIIQLEEMMSKIHLEFMKYVSKQNIKTDLEYISDDNLNYLIEDIIKENSSNTFDLRKEGKIIDYLKDFQYNDDIIGVILLTERGKLLFSSLGDTDLKKFLKEVDFRVKICNNSILKMFYTSKQKELIFSESIDDLYILILIFESKIKFGIADFYLQKSIKRIKALLEN
jgi:hypothetical protein